MDRPAGLRERKKMATRRALHEAALRLVAAHGLDGVTIDAIVEAADVSRRTFNNYFSSKEEVLLYGDQIRVRRLVDLVRARPPDEAPWAALTHAAQDLAAETADHDPAWLTQTRLLRGHPALLAQQVATYAVVERDLAAAIADRMPADPATAIADRMPADPATAIADRMPADPAAPLRARLLAATFLTTLRVATQHWLDHPEGSLTELVRHALTVTRDRFE
ncbi:TetR/AcrR family transcriptional regulator [Planosporangium sp. 12N6]|uniref:TetR/AcrR family transcriptional regulator n=1 Tax=Planosporangium spinosum TaxID=3402278 RepID=UPI003CFA055B